MGLPLPLVPVLLALVLCGQEQAQAVVVWIVEPRSRDRVCVVAVSVVSVVPVGLVVSALGALVVLVLEQPVDSAQVWVHRVWGLRLLVQRMSLRAIPVVRVLTGLVVVLLGALLLAMVGVAARLGRRARFRR